MIATAPLPAEVWQIIGLTHRETWSDYRHLIIYGQRTADDRMVFGGAALRITSAPGFVRFLIGCLESLPP
jgi:hypothetical protein